MRHRDYRISRRMEHHPTLGIGLFFILLGIALGSIYNYFTWETAMIFIGLLLVLNLHFTGGLLLVAGGVWFMLDEFHFATPDLIRTIYWPAVVVLLGLSFIISALFKRDKYNN
jgi:hypothetical protein